MRISKAKKLIFMLTAFVFVLLGATAMAIVLADANQSNQEIQLTTYDYLPISVTDGVVSAYTGVRDGTAYVEIPATYSLSETGLPIEGSEFKITNIQAEAFKDANFAFAKIDVSNIENIGESAFENAQNVYFAGGEQGYIIGANAFKNATVAFEHLVLTASAGTQPSVGQGAFECSKLFDAKNQIEFLGKKMVFASDYVTSGTKIVIDANSALGIVKIASNAFLDNETITQVDFSDFFGTLKIEDSAFAGTLALDSVNLGRGTVLLQDSVFANSTIASFVCNGLVTKLGKTTQNSASGAFLNCTNLQSAKIDGFSGNTIPSGLFANCTNLKQFDMSNFLGLQTIENSAFSGCTNLQSVALPAGLQTVGTADGASTVFAGCTNLQTVASGASLLANTLSLATNTTMQTVDWLPSGTKTICSNAFNNWTALTKMVVPSSVNLIEESAFFGCSSLAEYVAPYIGGKISQADSYTPENIFGWIFGKKNFAGAVATNQKAYIGGSTQSITFYVPQTLTTFVMTELNPVTKYSFYNCKTLQNVKFEKTVTRVGSYSFYGCSGITSMDFSEGKYLTRVEQNAFANCTGLVSVDFSGCVIMDKIYDSAFSGCKALSSINFYNCAKLSTFGAGVFRNCTSLKKLDNFQCPLFATVSPNSFLDSGIETLDFSACTKAVTINSNAFQNCKSLKSVTLPQKIKNLASSTFLGCTALKTLTIPAATEEIGENAFSGSGLNVACFGKSGSNSGYLYFEPNSIITSIVANALNGITKIEGELANFSSLTSFCLPTTLTAYASSVESPSNVVLSKFFAGSAVQNLTASQNSSWMICRYVTDGNAHNFDGKIDIVSLSQSDKVSDQYLGYLKTFETVGNYYAIHHVS